MLLAIPPLPWIQNGGKCLLWLGETNAVIFDVRGTGEVQNVTLAGGTGVSCFEAGFEYDSAADKFVRFGLDGKVYVLDPVTKAWTVNNPAGAPEGKPHGPFGRWRYVPVLNAFVVVTGIDENVHFYKLTAGAGKSAEVNMALPAQSVVQPGKH